MSDLVTALVVAAARDLMCRPWPDWQVFELPLRHAAEIVDEKYFLDVELPLIA